MTDENQLNTLMLLLSFPPTHLVSLIVGHILHQALAVGVRAHPGAPPAHTSAAADAADAALPGYPKLLAGGGWVGLLLPLSPRPCVAALSGRELWVTEEVLVVVGVGNPSL